jgi:pentatricopeptide repeat-containing protein PET309
MWKEIIPGIIPGRTRSFRATLSSFFLLPRFSSSISPFRTLFRTAATYATARSNPPPEHMENPLLYLTPDYTRSRHFHPEDSWTAYTLLRGSDDIAQVSYDALLTLAEATISTVEGVHRGVDTSAPRSWGLRLSDLMQDIELRGMSQPNSLRQMCIAARLLALRGDVAGAVSAAQAIVSEIETRKLMGPEAQARRPVFGSCLAAVWRQAGVVEALQFTNEHWESVFKRAANAPAVSGQRDAEVTALRSLMNALVETVDAPAELFSDHAETWSEEMKQRIGLFMVSSLSQLDRRVDDALAVYNKLQRQKVPGNYFMAELNLLRALAQDRNFAEADAVFKTLTKRSTERERNSIPYLVGALHLHAMRGDEVETENYFNKLSSRRAPTPSERGMYLYAYARNAHVDQVVALFDEFYPADPSGRRANKPGVQHFSAVIFAHAQANDFDGMNGWLATMTANGITADEYVYTDVLRSFAMRGDVRSVNAVLRQMREARLRPGVVTYTIAMKVFGNRRDPVTVEQLFKQALAEGVRPDQRMLTTLMNAHVEAGSWRGVVRVFDYMRRSSVRLTIETYNTLLKAYVLIGAPWGVVAQVARRLEDSGLRPDERTYAIVIQSACDAGDMVEARRLFWELDDKQQEGTIDGRVNVYVMTIIMAGFLRQKDTERATKVFDDMRDRGIDPTSVTYSTILRLYTNTKSEDDLKLAEEFLQDLLQSPERRAQWILPTYGRSTPMENILAPVLSAYVKLGDRVEDIERTLREVVEAGDEPPLELLTFLLDGYRRAFNIEAVDQLWPQILKLALERRYSDSVSEDARNLLPSNDLLAFPLSIYIDAQSTAAQPDKIAEAWQKLQLGGFVFSAHNWNHLAVALVRAGEFERAFEIIERVLLPYHRQTLRLIKARNREPDSPLVFDDLPTPDNEPEPAPADASALRNQTRRQRAMGTANRKAETWFDGNSEHADDLAHPLYMLHQVSPSWNTWSPHDTTLASLASVISQLERGRLPRAVRPFRPHARGSGNVPGDAASGEHAATGEGPLSADEIAVVHDNVATDEALGEALDDPEESDNAQSAEEPRIAGGRRERARELLARIRNDYPRTLYLIRQRGDRIRRKRFFKQQRAENAAMPRSIHADDLDI